MPRIHRPTDHELTLVIPAFNESRRLGATLSAAQSRLDCSKLDYRVLVVDDGSQDETAALTEDFGRRFSSLRLPQNRGKGAAVRAGMLAATGVVVAFTDADLPFDLSSLFEGYAWVRDAECHAVFGARDLRESSAVASRKFARRLASSVFRALMSIMVSREVTDTQCGLKIFSRTAATEIFSRTTIDGFAFDAEVVYLAEQMGVPIRRIPVRLVNEHSSTLSIRRHALPMLADVMRIRVRRYPDLAAATQRLQSARQVPAQRRAA
jgi:glycosyltransferase involved in cell wall biosynthesis